MLPNQTKECQWARSASERKKCISFSSMSCFFLFSFYHCSLLSFSTHSLPILLLPLSPALFSFPLFLPLETYLASSAYLLAPSQFQISSFQYWKHDKEGVASSGCSFFSPRCLPLFFFLSFIFFLVLFISLVSFFPLCLLDIIIIRWTRNDEWCPWQFSVIIPPSILDVASMWLVLL